MPSTTPPQIAIVFIRHPNGAYFVHQRVSTKRSYPSLFGIGAGGSIENGETPSAGAARELREETGLSTPLTFVTSFAFNDRKHAHDIHLFATESKEMPEHCESEWIWSGWMHVNELEGLFNAGKLCPDTAEAFVRYRQWLRIA